MRLWRFRWRTDPVVCGRFVPIFSARATTAPLFDVGALVAILNALIVEMMDRLRKRAPKSVSEVASLRM